MLELHVSSGHCFGIVFLFVYVSQSLAEGFPEAWPFEAPSGVWGLGVESETYLDGSFLLFCVLGLSQPQKQPQQQQQPQQQTQQQQPP